MATHPDDLLRLMKNIRIHAPGAVDPVIKLELFNAFDEFFRDSGVWEQEINFTIRSGKSDYEIWPDSGAIITLMSLVNATNIPVPATMEEPGIIILNTEPSNTEVLTATVKVTVADPNDTDDYPYIPSWLLKRYYTTLLDGTVSKLMMQPAKPYTNERLGIVHMRKFRSGIAVAQSQSRHKNLHGGVRWQFPTGFRAGSQRG